jgi:OFA family oxalate/formate antiporter-like MFS transporter
MIIRTSGEIHRSWRLVVVACIGLGCNPSALSLYSIGAFIKPLETNFGWSRTVIQAGALFAVSLGALTYPLIGQLVDRHGARRIIFTGLVGIAAGFLLAAAMRGALWQYYTAFAVLSIFGAGASPVAWARVISANFERQRGLALGLTMSGTGLCAILIPPIIVWLIGAYGWRVGYIGLALLPLALALPLAVINVPRTDQNGARNIASSAFSQDSAATLPGYTTGEAVMSYRFWVLAASVIFLYLGILGVAPNLIPALTDRGFTPQAAASAVSAYGVCAVLGRVAVGWLIDRFWAPGIATLTLTPAALACVILMSKSSYGMSLFAAGLVGLAAGAELDLLAYLVTRYFGLRNYARTYGILYAIVGVSGGIAPFAFAHLYDLTKSYQLGFGISAVFFAVGGLILLSLARYPVLRTRVLERVTLAAGSMAN